MPDVLGELKSLTDNLNKMIKGLGIYAVYYAIASIILPFVFLQLFVMKISGLTLVEAVSNIDPRLVMVYVFAVMLGLASDLVLLITSLRMTKYSAVFRRGVLASQILLTSLGAQLVGALLIVSYFINPHGLKATIGLALLSGGLVTIIAYSYTMYNLLREMDRVIPRMNAGSEAGRLFLFHFIPVLGVLLLMLSVFVLYIGYRNVSESLIASTGENTTS
ncbi:MAG: hypothetical protein GSR77_01190 [Desulfurococcales archaeon]|nr:hypothetical protein [Desulfurococcales archaeon]